jgi:hypothetical protein
VCDVARPEGKYTKQTQSRPPAEDVGRERPTPDQAGGRLYEEPKRAKRTQFGPVGGGCRRVNAQNEAKLGGTGVYGRRPSPCGPCPGRGTRNRGLEIADCGLEDGPLRAGARGEVCKTKPIWPRPEARGGSNYAKRTQFGPAGGRCRRAKAQNEPNLARHRRGAEGIVRNEPNLARPGAGVGEQMRKTNPIWGPEPPAIEDCGFRVEGRRPETTGKRVGASSGG